MALRFELQFTRDAIEDLRWLRKTEQKEVLAELETRLSYDPATETRNRKRLRPNKLAEWELRIGRFRIFYDLDQEAGLIRVVAVGYKRDSRLFIRGKEYQL